MPPVFSASLPTTQEDQHPQLTELHILPNAELLDIWEQTQRAAWALQEKGWDTTPALRYGSMLVWEMQRRLTHLPEGEHFGENRSTPAVPSTTLPHFITL